VLKLQGVKKFKRHRDLGLFDQDFRLEKLSKLGDPLERLNQGVDFELFRDLLLEHLLKLPKGKGGRPPYDYVLMFKILILQRYYNLSDDQTEFQICDRLTFMRFLGISVADDVPDSKTIWNFREQITDLSLEEKLFELFLKELERLNLVVNEGKIIDASFVEVPKQRNSRADNKTIKEGKTPKDWEDKPNKKAQKDTDARWTKKRNQSYFGYKNHIKTCSKSKIITKYKVTDACVHDSQATEDLLDQVKDKGEDFYADSAYTGEKQEDIIKQKGVINQVCEKGYKNNPLTEEQKENNKEKSKTRVRVEHIFGFMENSMNGMYIKVIGTKRVTSVIGLMNLTYNMFRKIQLTEPLAG
jgi:transposase, IS5 family